MPAIYAMIEILVHKPSSYGLIHMFEHTLPLTESLASEL
jgi:hypothetical protein